MGRNQSPVPAKESLGISTMLQINAGWLRSWSNNSIIYQTVLWLTQRRMTYRSITHAENLYWVYCGRLVYGIKWFENGMGRKNSLGEPSRDANSKAKDTWTREKEKGRQKRGINEEVKSTLARVRNGGDGTQSCAGRSPEASLFPQDSRRPSSRQNELIGQL